MISQAHMAAVFEEQGPAYVSRLASNSGFPVSKFIAMPWP